MSAQTTEPVQRGSLAKINDSTTFYAHQVDGVRQLARMGSFLLADEMGLGKSLQALTVAAVDFEQGWAKRTLVVAPATLKLNWADEMDKHTSFTYQVLDGTPKQRATQLATFAADGADVLVINYEQIGSHLADLNGLNFDVCVMDEAHYIKSHKSARSKAAHALRAKRFFLLTGSPMLNHVNELWSLLHRIDPIEYPKYWTFTHRYCVYGGFKDKQIVGVKHQAELTERLKAVMVRRLKKDVLTLPGKSRVDIYVDAHPEQAKLIKQAVDEMKIDLPGNPNPMELENALTKFLRLKQILGTTANIAGYPDHSFKLDRCVAMVEEIIGNGRPVVVFTQFRGTLACIVQRLTAAGIDSRQLHGDVPASDRQPIVRAWGEDAAAGRPQALVAMLQVAGVGLNMTAASEAIFVDELFVPKLNEQAEDRFDRIGQTVPVTIYRLRVRKSIEQRIAKILERKTDLFDQVVEVNDWKRRLFDALMEDEDT